MLHTSVSRRVAAPLPVVWEVFADVRTAAATVTGVRDLEVLSEADRGLGTRWRETRTAFGRTTTEEFEVVTYEHERRYAFAATQRGTHYRTELTFDALGTDATTVLAVFTARSRNPLAAAAAWLVWPVTRRTVRKLLSADVDDLAAEAERRAGDVPHGPDDAEGAGNP
jgi:hypothetical protein